MSLREDMENGDGISESDPWAKLGDKLMDKTLKELHTQIDKPDQFTVLDVYADWCDEAISPLVSKILHGYADRYRTNMVAYKRERAKEVERMVKGQREEENAKKDMREVLIGDLRR